MIDNARLAVLEKLLEGLTESAKDLQNDVKQVSKKVDHVDFRLSELEKKFEAITPSISDFNTIRNQATGAARLVQFAWFIGAAVVAAGIWLINHTVTIT